MSTATGSGSSRECSVVTVGTYDGVHLGHRRLIDETKRSARELGCKSVVVTFSVHPSKVLRPEAPVPLLCTLEEKIALLRATGIDEVVVLDFDAERARESAEDFVIRDLVGRLFVAEVVVGSNFRFGYKRHGDVALLQRLGGEYGFVTKGVDLVLDDEHHSVVSSTRIRSLIGAGELRGAAHLLGRPYLLSGTLDPALALHVDDELLVPPPGSYRVTLSQTRSDDAAQSLATPGTARVDAAGAIMLTDALGDGGFDLSRPVDVSFASDRDQPPEGDR